MQQFLLALLLVLGGLSYYLWNENGVLKENNAKLEVAIQTQEEAIATLQSDFALQSTQLNEMTVKSQQAQRELNRYSEFIRNYELSAKIMGDPVEMQRKINNGTKHIMEDIEELSNIVDDLDDGLQLQPTPIEDIRGECKTNRENNSSTYHASGDRFKRSSMVNYYTRKL